MSRKINITQFNFAMSRISLVNFYIKLINWQEIYGKGGRKFGFMNLPTLGCLPGMRIIKPENNGSCLEEASKLAHLHNQALSKLLKRLAKHLNGFKYSLYDFNNSLRKRTTRPSRFGMLITNLIAFQN